MVAPAHSVSLLERFMAAWNSHDVDELMACMTDEPVFIAAAGGEGLRGKEYRGAEAVRRGYEGIFETFRDARWEDASHSVSADRGFSAWTFRGTHRDSGESVEVLGCDLFRLEEGSIAVKDSYRKQP